MVRNVTDQPRRRPLLRSVTDRRSAPLGRLGTAPRPLGLDAGATGVRGHDADRLFSGRLDRGIL